MFRQKTKNIIGLAKKLVAEHYDVVPRSLAQLIELPYRGDGLSMVFILPREDLASLEKKLDASMLASALSVLSGPASVEVFVPRFKLSSSEELSTPLRAMGMTAPLASIWSDANRKYLASQQHASDVVGGFGSTAKVLRMMLQSGVLAVGAYLVIYQEATAGIIIAGAILSVMTRMAKRDGFNLEFEVGRKSMRYLGALRPWIGAMFALAVYVTLKSSLVVLLPDVDHGIYYFATIGFIAGFSERRAKVLLNSTGVGSESEPETATSK